MGTADTSESTLQGLKYQGLKYQGLKYQGLKYQGLKYQGLKYQGLKYQGLKYQGCWNSKKAKAMWTTSAQRVHQRIVVVIPRLTDAPDHLGRIARP